MFKGLLLFAQGSQVPLLLCGAPVYEEIDPEGELPDHDKDTEMTHGDAAITVRLLMSTHLMALPGRLAL